MGFAIHALKNISLMYFKPGEQKSKLKSKKSQCGQSNSHLNRAAGAAGQRCGGQQGEQPAVLVYVLNQQRQ